MAACEHCKHDPDTAKAALDQTKAALETAKREAAKAIGDSAALHAEHKVLADFKAAAEPQLAKLQGDLGVAAQNAALARRGFTDEAKASGFRAFYGIYAAEAGAQAKPFDAWLDGDAKSHPILAPHFQAPAAQGTSVQAVTDAGAGKGAQGTDAGKAAGKANPLPNSNAGAVADPGRQGAMSPQQVREFFQSPGFKKLTGEQQKAKRVELETQIRTARQAPV